MVCRLSTPVLAAAACCCPRRRITPGRKTESWAYQAAEHTGCSAEEREEGRGDAVLKVGLQKKPRSEERHHQRGGGVVRVT